MQTPRPHLKNARLGAGLTAFELAQIIGATENKVYGIERGRYRPEMDLALRWSAALGLNPEQAFPELFGGVAQ